MTRLPRPLRVALWSAVAFQLLLLGLRVVLEVRILRAAGAGGGGVGALADLVTLLVTMAAFPVVGVVILRRLPTSVVGWLFCVTNLGLIGVGARST